MSANGQARDGFVLAEVIVVLVISSVVVVTLLAGLVALVRGLQPQSVKLAGEELPIAPTFGSFPSAVRLHQCLTNRVAAARAVYVFGGQHVGVAADAPPTQLRPLVAQALPTITEFKSGLPLQARGFYDAYAGQLGDQDDRTGAEDFSVLVIGVSGSQLAITCFAQVRRTELSVFDGAAATPYVVREVKLWDLDDGYLRYAFAERALAASRVFIGAVHTWLRYRLDTVGEEGPACVVFPDPWLYQGARGQPDDIPAFSRFSYFFAVSP